MTSAAISARRWLDQGSTLTVLGVASAMLLLAALQLAPSTIEAVSGAARSTGPLTLALFATLATAAATGFGGLPVLFLQDISQRNQDTLLGFGAGVMLAASCFSLILPALESGATIYGEGVTAGLVVGTALALGAAALLAADRWLPHEHFIKGREGGGARHISRIWLFVLAITLHNVPEGLAVGVAIGGEGAASALPLAVGIGLQNIPEGLVVALALVTAGLTPARAALVAFGSGLVEPLGGLFGAGVVALAQPLLPWGLAFSAGAMLFVVSHEIIPESHRKGHETFASAGLVLGFITMMMFDTMLG